MKDEEPASFYLATQYQENPLNPEEPILNVMVVPDDVQDGEQIECYQVDFATAINFAARLSEQTCEMLKKRHRFQDWIASRPDLWEMVGRETIN